MGGKIVHDDDVARRQGWDQTVFEIGAEDQPVHRSIDDKGRSDRIAAQTGDKSGDLPMPVRHAADEPLAAPATSAQPRHVGAGAGLVDEHQPRRIKRGLIFFPTLPRLSHVGAFLLAGVHDFF